MKKLKKIVSSFVIAMTIVMTLNAQTKDSTAAKVQQVKPVPAIDMKLLTIDDMLAVMQQLEDKVTHSTYQKVLTEINAVIERRIDEWRKNLSQKAVSNK